MRNSNKLYLAILLAFALFVCWKIGAAYETEKLPDVPVSDEELRESFPYLALIPMDEGTEMTSPVRLDLSGRSNGYTITEAGEYHLTGELQGSLVIDAPEQNVHLFLDNVTITARSGPAVYCQDANKFVITLMPGTDNIISDSGDYRADTEVEACIYSACDMTINGSGKLTVNGYYKDAIRSKDIVRILDGVYAIKCKRTAIHGTDGIVVKGGDFTISSEKVGLKSTKTGAQGRGNIIISGGEFSIIAGRYSFVTEKANLYIYDCAVYQRSVVSPYDVAGTLRVQEGCVQ